MDAIKMDTIKTVTAILGGLTVLIAAVAISFIG